MLIQDLRIIPDLNSDHFAWSGLSRFHNVSYTTQRLCEDHNIPTSQHKNAKKQAAQIRYCLVQAREYFQAANTVSISTKPVLLYYGLMSLALAEILLKQDGNSSLDLARGHHAHHGLDFRLSNTPPQELSLGDNAGKLRATPLRRGSERFGTFELWH